MDIVKKIYTEPKVISEIGCNHKGNINIAFELIKLSKESGATIAKFQKRNSTELLSEEQYNSPHPIQHNSYGNTYGEHREFLEFNIDQHARLKEYCEKIGIIYSTSVWDVTSVKEIINLNPIMIKVPSACNLHFNMLEILREDYDGEIHISLGMTTNKEKDSIINFFHKNDSLKERVVLYACTSGYPVSFEESCLLEITKLRHDLQGLVKGIGFSGHHLGIAIDVAAYTLGAKWIERHFTKNRAWKGTDHAASLEPNGLNKLTRDLNATFKALSYKERDILDVEIPHRKKLKYIND